MKFTDSEIIDLLLKFYPALNKKSAESLFSISTYKIFNPKELILKKGRKDRKMFIALKGASRSCNTIDGVEYNCHLRSDGYIMGDANSFGEDPTALLDTIAITECHVLVFKADQFEKLAYEDKDMMQFYLKVLKEIVTTFAHRINSFVSMNSQERYNDLMQWNPGYLEDVYDKHLASFLGITPLTFHRIKHKKQ